MSRRLRSRGLRPLVLLVLTALLSASCGTTGLHAAGSTPPLTRVIPSLPPLGALQLPDDGALRHDPLRGKHPLRLPPRRSPRQS